jgi:hypothetical protein
LAGSIGGMILMNGKERIEVKGKIVLHNKAFDATNIKPFFISYGQTGIYHRRSDSGRAYSALGVIQSSHRINC